MPIVVSHVEHARRKPTNIGGCGGCVVARGPTDGFNDMFTSQPGVRVFVRTAVLCCCCCCGICHSVSTCASMHSNAPHVLMYRHLLAWHAYVSVLNCIIFDSNVGVHKSAGRVEKSKDPYTVYIYTHIHVDGALDGALEW